MNEKGLLLLTKEVHQSLWYNAINENKILYDFDKIYSRKVSSLHLMSSSNFSKDSEYDELANEEIIFNNAKKIELPPSFEVDILFLLL